MAVRDVHGELTTAREPFCGLLGMTVGQNNSFVLENILSCQYMGLNLLYCIYCTRVSPVCRVFCVRTYI